MRARQIVLALHLDQSRFGAREFGTQALAIVQLDDRQRSRGDQLHTAVVELVDEFDKSPCAAAIRKQQKTSST